jgi:protoporphyrinogen oxidase
MDAVIIGAGPAGLTAAFELLERTRYRPVVLEATSQIGGLSQTFLHHGNRMDIGGHRFFSKSDRVLEWWFRFLPLQALPEDHRSIFYHGHSKDVGGNVLGPDPELDELVMLVRRRRSRIYYLKELFPYPIRLTVHTLLKLGLGRSALILLSYLRAAAFPPKQIDTLEDFFISRFGRRLYETFFKSYTEKVWGVPCRELSAEWGAQRVKSLSIPRALGHSPKRYVRFLGRTDRKAVETSLIEQFLYPKLGPGQMWETVAAEIEHRGGRILKNVQATRIRREGTRVTGVSTDTHLDLPADVVFSTMPIKDLVAAIDPALPDSAREIAGGLVYRDFVTVGLLLPRLALGTVGDGGTVRDNWIYIHDTEVDAGRLQLFNNWSPYLVENSELVWVGVEYFCNEGDELWSRLDAEMVRRTMDELRRLGIVDVESPLDSVVVRMPKAYPAYRGTYGRFGELRKVLDSLENLFLVGRNGMHRYNNQDHSMLAAMTAVDNLVEGRSDRSNLWEVSAEEEEYHESRRSALPS